MACELETHDHDVVVIGAGGAGLRAAIEASALGARTALVCKSLLGKAHTVMAEGGIAAALGNVDAADDWQIALPGHDARRQVSSTTGAWPSCTRKEAPDRVRELEQWGGVFDRTPDGPDVAARVRRPHATGGSCTSATAPASS